MSSVVPRVTQVDVIEPYRLAVGFGDGSGQTIDLEPLLQGKWFGALRDLALFRSVAIDPHGSLTWPNGVTVSCWTLRDWPTAGPELIATVQKNARNTRRLQIFQRWFVAALLIWSALQWIGWVEASSRDMLMSGALVAMSTGTLVQERSTAWSLVLLIVSIGLLVAFVALR
jgi:hypothetical protein